MTLLNLNLDCMEALPSFPDNYFGLAIVDPPYGGNCSRSGGTWAARWGKKAEKMDIPPGPEYFTELFRVSRNQIIWGGNYFAHMLPPSRCWVVWKKLTISENFTMAMAELAWTSFNDNTKLFSCIPQIGDSRIHPQQKPVDLYEWLLYRYAKPGDVILDTHSGSASSLVACHNKGFTALGLEKDPDYHAAAQERLASL